MKIGKFLIDEIYCGDALQLLKDIPDESIDLIITDPPFAIDFKERKNNYNRNGERVIKGYNEIPKEKYYEFSYRWIKEAHRILKITGSMYIFSGWTNLKDVLNAIEDAGFIQVNHLIWKYQFGVYTERKFVTSHYHILFVVKNPKKYKFNKIEHYPEDVIVINREYWTGKLKTPTKLPKELVRKLILFSSDEGDIILDPFLGSGTVVLVAKLLNRHFIGFEIVSEYCEFARKRISNLEEDLFVK